MAKRLLKKVSDSIVKLRLKLENLTDFDLRLLLWKLQWKAQARKKQIEPDGKWFTWGIRSGRGFGKTLSGAQWIGQAGAADPGSINFVVAPTFDDVRYICFEGPTGLLSVIPPEFIAAHNKNLPSITLTNGTYFRGFSADTPDRLRGPQCHRVWCEEIASWLYPEEALSNIEFGLRLGKNPQMLWTGTPRPTKFMKMLSEDAKSVVVLGSSYENRENLTDRFYDNIAKYEGTAIGRQEIYGELLDPEEGGFVKRSQIRLWPASTPLPKFKFLVLSLDTAFTDETFDKKKQKTDPTAGSVWGLFDFEKKLNVMLLDAWEDKLGFPQLVTRVKREKEKTYGDADEPKITAPLINKYGEDTGKKIHHGRKPDLIIIEDKGSGISLRQSLAVENILTHPYNPGRLDKLSRLHLVSPLFAHSRVWAPESNKFRGRPISRFDTLISQVCTFVGEGSIENDDLLDTTTQALRFFIDKYFGAFTFKVDADAMQRMKAVQDEKRRKRINPYGT